MFKGFILGIIFTVLAAAAVGAPPWAVEELVPAMNDLA
jgi:hypothetical protein